MHLLKERKVRDESERNKKIIIVNISKKDV